MADPTGREGASTDDRSRGRRERRLGSSGLIQQLWAGEGGLATRAFGALLAPAELGFRAAVRARDVLYRSGTVGGDAPPVPTISVGNITVGGTGKTPMVRWLVLRLADQGRTPGILHGGYAEDEPELHRRWYPDLPVVADRNRLRGAGVALRKGADVLVLDDAFQHRAMGRDLDVVLVAAETWTRYARLLPRGPYRESPRALRRADLVIVTRRGASPTEAARAEVEVARISGRPTARVHLRPAGWLDGRLRPRDESAPPGPAIAVAAVAGPDHFFDQAESAGARLTDAITFPDHHDYTPSDAVELVRSADGRAIVTTAKDAVKLAVLLPEVELWVLEQAVVFETGEDTVTDAVDRVAS